MDILLILILIIPIASIQAFAQENPDSSSIIIQTDQTSYEIGDSVIITGIVEEKRMPVAAIRIFDPDDKIVSANEVLILDDNSFSKTINLEVPIYEKIGIYTIVLNYGKLESVTYFEVGSEFFELESPSDDFSAFEFPEVLVITDRAIYEDGDTILITGLVSEIKEPTVLVGVYDPFGFPAGFYFGDVTSNLEFTVTFPAKSGVNFKTEGTYSIIARYGDSEDKITFDFVEKLENSQDDANTIPDDNKETLFDEDNNGLNNNSETDDQNNNKETTPNNNDKKIDLAKDSTKQISQNPNPQPIPQQKQSKNLSVEDVELGKILNKMNLECDKSEYSDIVSYYDSMGPALIRLCKYGEAITYYDSTLMQNPKNVEALNNKGSALSSLGFYSEAISFFDSALDVNSNFTPAINNKANALASLGQYEDAISLFERGLQLAPDDLILYSNLESANEKYSSMKDQEKKSAVVQEEPPIAEKSEPKPTVLSNNVEEPNFIEQISSALSSISETIKNLLP